MIMRNPANRANIIVKKSKELKRTWNLPHYYMTFVYLDVDQSATTAKESNTSNSTKGKNKDVWMKIIFGLLIISWFKFKFMVYYFVWKKAECVCISRCKWVFSWANMIRLELTSPSHFWACVWTSRSRLQFKCMFHYLYRRKKSMCECIFKRELSGYGPFCHFLFILHFKYPRNDRENRRKQNRKCCICSSKLKCMLYYLYIRKKSVFGCIFRCIHRCISSSWALQSHVLLLKPLLPPA